MKKLLIMKGIQGSGKSYAARKWVLEDPEHRVRFNNDDIRNMLGKYWVPSREDIITELKKEFLNQAKRKSYDIVMDNMNLNPKEIDFLEKWALLNGYIVEFRDFFSTPLEECIKRDASRENPIGEDVIRNTYNKYRKIIEGLE